MDIQIPSDVSLLDEEKPIWFGRISWASAWLSILIALIFLITIIGIIIAIPILILV